MMRRALCLSALDAEAFLVLPLATRTFPSQVIRRVSPLEAPGPLISFSFLDVVFRLFSLILAPESRRIDSPL